MTDLAAAVRHEFDALDAEVPVFNIKLLEDRVNDSLSRERLVSIRLNARVRSFILSGETG